MPRHHKLVRWLLPLAGIAMIAGAIAGDETPQPTYVYGSNGVTDSVTDRTGDRWRLLVDESVLGGKELAMAELTMPAGTTVPAHEHGTVEIIYVLSGVYGHEVNGKLYLLKPGMVGIVRPGDRVRHLVPSSGPVKLLVLWAPAGDAARIVPRGAPTAAVPQARNLEP